jgi:transposase
MRTARKGIRLTRNDRDELEAYTTTGTRSVKLLKRAEMILLLDTSDGRVPEREARIAERVGISRQTVQKVKNDFLKSADVHSFLQRKKRETPPVPAKVTGDREARIIALACGKAPAGFSKWSLRLLADTCVELHYVDALSHMTVSRLLKKHNLNPI